MYLKYRGGCVIFLDYSECVASDIPLVLGFLSELISSSYLSVYALITKKLLEMESQGVSLKDDLHMFGFSLGAESVIQGALGVGEKRVESISSEKIFIEDKTFVIS